MRISRLKRVGSGVLAAAIAASTYVGAALPASARTAGKDGSAEMNEAYAAHESLMPIGPSFSSATILEWTPESDPDARYSRASIPLANRTGGFIVNPKANPEAKLMLCSIANSAHDTTGAQGTDNFMSWSFNYWQYADSFVYWSGSKEGIITCPTGEFTDAAHANGVPVVATLGFPWGTGTGYVEEVRAFTQQAEDGSFPVADKLIEVMEYYGFDGYFFNQESFGCSAEDATKLNEMMKYMRKKCPDILISWYDAMVPSGGISHQDAVNDQNKAWMEPDAEGNYCADEFFMNYNWYESEISTTINTMNSINRSPFDAYAGLDVQQNGMNTDFRDYLLLDANGKMKLSFALYCPNSTLGISASGEEFHKNERTFYVNKVSDPRVETSDPTIAANSEWVGMSRFFADKTPITSAPFVTNFNSGHGKGYWVDGVLLRDREWSYQSNQDIMPTWTWIIDSEGSKLSGDYDFTDAYNGGNSIKFAGSLDAGKSNDIMLYSTDVAVTDGMNMSLTYKNDDGKMKLVAYYGDETTTSYEDCTRVYYNLTAGEADTWTTTSVDLSAQAGKTLFAIGMQIESDTDVSDYQVNLGQLTITEQDRAELSGPSGITLDGILYHDAYDAEIRLYWDETAGASSYEVYKVNGDGTSSLLMETPNTALYISSVARAAEEQDVTLKVVSINKNGVRGEGTTFTIDWLYGNEDSEKYEPVEFENFCLGATVTDVSFENDAEPAAKALDGTAANGSKWCATNKDSGYMAIDIGREVTVRRWRVEHAEYGGEQKKMNTIDFALEYKNAEGQWVEAKRIQNNKLALTDVLLDEPVTAREWRLNIYDAGSSAWGAIRIYEWQMFDTDQLSQTESTMAHFASARNNPGATDVFTLEHVPVGETVKVYIKSGDTYTEIGSKVAQASGNEKLTTVTIENLDFATDKAGRIYYTTTAPSCFESIKQSTAFDAETAEKSAPATEVSFEKYSQPGSESSSQLDDIFTTMTVNGLNAGDVVYVYESGAETWTRMSQPVAVGETSAVFERIRVPRAGGELTLQVKRAGKLISDKYTVTTPAFAEPTANISLKALSTSGEVLSDVVYEIYDASGEYVKDVSTEEMAAVEFGTYTLKCKSVPEGYRVTNEQVMKIVRIEGYTYEVTVTIRSDSDVPTVTSVEVTPFRVTVKKGDTQQFTASVTGENDPGQDVIWKVENAVSASTQISEDGILTVGEDETAKTLTVIATSEIDETKSGSATVTVAEKESETENVSLGAEVIAYNGGALGGAQGPEKLFDGDITSQDTGKWCVDGNDKWVAFDIGEARELTQLKMVHAGAAGETPAGKINTANYEFYVLDEENISVDDLLAKTFEERTELLEDNSYWKLIASTTDNINDITTNDLTGNSGRIFKINISRTDTTGLAQCVRVYELELYSPVPPADKTALNTLIAEVEALKEADYTTATWAALTEKLDAAKAVAGEPDASQDAVDAAYDALFEAKEALVKRGDKTALNTLIAEVEALKEADYTTATWAVLIEKLNAAKAVAGEPDASQDAVDAAYDALFEAKEALVKRADKTALNTLIAEVEALKEADYTTATWAALIEKLDAAKAVAGEPDALQDTVDAAYDALLEAKGALVASGDQSALLGLLNTAKELDLSKYTEESGQAILAAIKAAEDVIAARGTDEEIEAAYAELEKALTDAELLPTEPEDPEVPTDPENPDTSDNVPLVLPIALLMTAAVTLIFKKRREVR